MRRRLLGSLAVVCLLAAPFAGCHRNGIPLAKARGTVTVDGKPLAQGSIQFMPDNSKGTRGPMAVGGIDSKGQFVLRTFRPEDGAQVGFHKVVINCWEVAGFDPKNPKAGPVPRSLIPECYADEVASGLDAEVKPGIQNEFTFELKSSGSGIPPR